MPDQYTLNEGLLKTTRDLSLSGQFAPSNGTEGLEQFIFGGAEETAEFYSIYSCDALGNPYRELKASGRGTLPFLLYVPKEFGSLGFLLASLQTPSLESIAEKTKSQKDPFIFQKKTKQGGSPTNSSHSTTNRILHQRPPAGRVNFCQGLP